MSVTSRHPDPATLSLYHDGEGAEEMLAGVEEHLSHCEECRAEVDRLRTITVELRDVPDLRAPLSVLRGVHEIISPEPPAKSSRWHGAAAAVVIVGVILAIYAFSPPGNDSQYEVARESDTEDALRKSSDGAGGVTNDVAVGAATPGAPGGAESLVMGQPQDATGRADFAKEDSKETDLEQQREAGRVEPGVVTRETDPEPQQRLEQRARRMKIDADSEEIMSLTVDPESLERSLRGRASKPAQSLGMKTAPEAVGGMPLGDDPSRYYQWRVVPESTDEMKKKSTPGYDITLPVRVADLDGESLDALARHLHVAIAIAADSPRSAPDGATSSSTPTAGAENDESAEKGGKESTFGVPPQSPVADADPKAILDIETEPGKLRALLRAARAWENLSKKKVLSMDDFFAPKDGFRGGGDTAGRGGAAKESSMVRRLQSLERKVRVRVIAIAPQPKD